MDKEKEIKNLINALGVTSEMTLIFFRNLLSNGATIEEASRLSQAFIAAVLYGNNNTGKTEET